MNSWKVILAVIVIFGAGVITGGLLVGHYSDEEKQAARASIMDNPTRPENRDHNHDYPPPPPLVKNLNKQFVQQMSQTLKLSAEQRTNILKIVTEGQEKNHALWTNVAPAMRKVMRDVHQQIQEVLTESQRKQFEQMMKHPPKKPEKSTNAPSATVIKTNAPAPFTNAPSLVATNSASN